jgi:hypothetical protein
MSLIRASPSLKGRLRGIFKKGRNRKEGTKPPLKATSPFPSRGRGIKGDGVKGSSQATD